MAYTASDGFELPMNILAEHFPLLAFAPWEIGLAKEVLKTARNMGHEISIGGIDWCNFLDADVDWMSTCENLRAGLSGYFTIFNKEKGAKWYIVKGCKSKGVWWRRPEALFAAYSSENSEQFYQAGIFPDLMSCLEAVYFRAETDKINKNNNIW